MDEDVDFAELISEPPGGVNHGRVRTETGWRDLETGETFSRSPGFNEEPLKHGTRYVAAKLQCPCGACRVWRRDDKRRQRASRRG